MGIFRIRLSLIWKVKCGLKNFEGIKNLFKGSNPKIEYI